MLEVWNLPLSTIVLLDDGNDGVVFFGFSFFFLFETPFLYEIKTYASNLMHLSRFLGQLSYICTYNCVDTLLKQI